jgi:hypothetical protein
VKYAIIALRKTGKEARLMSVSTIYVNRNGAAAQGIKVALSFAGGGMTKNVLTDRDGRAVIHHDGSGTATIYVNGQSRDTVRAPCTISVNL